MPSRVPAYLALIGAEIIFGALLIVVKPALSLVSANEFLFLRYLIALPFALPLLINTIIKHNFPYKSLPQLTLHEILAGLNILLLYYLLSQVSALEASLLITIRPVFITIAGVLLLKETEDKHEFIGLIIATVGATLIVAGPLNQKLPLGVNLGVLGIILTNIFDALLTVNFKKNLLSLPKQSLNLYHVSFSLLLYGFLNFPNAQHSLVTVLQNQDVLTSVAFAGILGSIVASLLSIYGYSKIEISEATLFSYIKPLVYIPLALIWLHEEINYTQIIGLLIILSGLALAETKQPQHWFTRLFKHSHHHHQHSYHLRH